MNRGTPSKPAFTVAADPSRDLVRITLHGFFTAETTAAFLRARNDAHRRLLCAPNQHATLADARSLPVQSREVVERYGATLADPAYRSRRLAIVTPSTLARIQLGRASGNPHVRFFTDYAEAEKWALAPGPVDAS